MSDEKALLEAAVNVIMTHPSRGLVVFATNEEATRSTFREALGPVLEHVRALRAEPDVLRGQGPLPCTCGRVGRRGAAHAHGCPVFDAWSWRDEDVRAELARQRARADRLCEERDRARAEAEHWQAELEGHTRDVTAGYGSDEEPLRFHLAKTRWELEQERLEIARLQREADALLEHLQTERAGHARLMSDLVAERDVLREQVESLNTELMGAALDAHLAEHPHLAPSAGQVARAVIEQGGGHEELRAELAAAHAERDEARQVARDLHSMLEQHHHLLHGGWQPEYPWLDQEEP